MSGQDDGGYFVMGNDNGLCYVWPSRHPQNTHNNAQCQAKEFSFGNTAASMFWKEVSDMSLSFSLIISCRRTQNLTIF